MGKNIFISVIILVCIGIMSCHAKNDNMPCSLLQPDSITVSHLGESLSELLFDNATVKCYALRNVPSVGKDDIAFNSNCVLGTLISTLSKQEKSVLQYIIPSDSANYHVNHVMIRSPYMPRLAFQFTKGKKKAWLLVSLSDRSWSVYYDGKSQFIYNYVDVDAVERLCNYYINLQKAQKPKK